MDISLLKYGDWLVTCLIIIWGVLLKISRHFEVDEIEAIPVVE